MRIITWSPWNAGVSPICGRDGRGPGSLSPVEAVIFVADQDDDGPAGTLGFLEGGCDAAGIGIAFDEVVAEAERHQKALGVGRGRVGRDAVAGPAAIADHHDDRDIEAQEPAADRVAGLHHAGVLDEDHWLLAAGVEPGRDRHRMALAAGLYAGGKKRSEEHTSELQSLAYL